MDAVSSRFWIFQTVSARYDLDKRLEPGRTENWVVSTFAEEIGPGDVVYLWQAESEAALFGWATVSGEVFQLPAAEQVRSSEVEDHRPRVELLYQARFDPPISRAEVRSHQALAGLDVLKTAKGTNFHLDPTQAITLNELARRRGAENVPPDPKIPAQAPPPDQHISSKTPPPERPVAWERLSAATQDVFGWAAASEEPNRVGTRGLLIGLLRTSQPSEAAQLLAYIGVEHDEVFAALQDVRPQARINPTVSSPTHLRTLPDLTPNGKQALDLAGRLQADADGLIELWHLFGALLQVDESRALQALEQVLEGRLNIETVRAGYVDYLQTAPSQSYSAFLESRFAGARPSTAITTDTWTDRDQLEHALYADAIAEFIQDSRTKAPLTIGIKAPWGAGKTSLMQMIRKQLDPGAFEPKQAKNGKRLTIWEFLRRTRGKTPEAAAEGLEPEVKRPFMTVWFNAWKYQSSEQLWAGLAHAILSQVGDRLPPADRDRLWASIQVRRLSLAELRRGFYRYVSLQALPYLLVVPVVVVGVVIAWALDPNVLRNASITGAIVGLVTAGVGVVSSVRDEVTKATPRLVEEPDYGSRLGFLHLVDSDMRKILEVAGATPNEPFVIFVDDLDRCSYGTVAQVIEALNVFLAGDFNNCIFVIAMEPDLVAAQIHIAYEKLFQRMSERGEGDDLGWRFLEKMVQLPLSLPEPHRPQVEQFVDSILATETEARIPEVDPDSAEVVEARKAIREAETSGSLEGIADAMNEVKADARTAGTATANLDAVLQKAARLEFKDRFSDAHARAMLMRHARELSGNPREIKRFINVFRFYAYVDFWRRTRGLDTPGLEGAAKLARIAISWPNLLSTLARDVTHNGTRAPLLAVLEDSGDDESWNRSVGLAPERTQAQLDGLRTVIGREPHVGDRVTGFL
jgi:KAP family P-loop domain/EVE domain